MDDEVRKIAGGSLNQTQVDELNKFVDLVTPSHMQKISASGIDLICSFEGLELKAYDDSVGILIIGFGTTVINGVKVKKGDTCTLEQAQAYITNDLKKFEAAVNKVTAPINQNQFDALVSLAYNIGAGAFEKSTLLKKMNEADYKSASTQLMYGVNVVVR